VAIADRLDTLVGCFAVGLAPTGTADPLALRRAAIGLLRTLLDRRWELSLVEAMRLACSGFAGVRLDLSEADTVEKLGVFLRERLRGLLEAPADVVDACLAASSDDPHDVRLRVAALEAILPEVRQSAGEVFKRAANIAKDAPEGVPRPPGELGEVHASEASLFDAFGRLRAQIASARERHDWASALAAIAELTPVMARYFEDVFVMVEDVAVRENRLRLMKELHRTCSTIANFNLLAKKAEA
jgi:glycyl-tRNA synthetase beta chain